MRPPRSHPTPDDSPPNAPSWRTHDGDIRRVRDARRLYRAVVAAGIEGARKRTLRAVLGDEDLERLLHHAAAYGLIALREGSPGNPLVVCLPAGEAFRDQYRRAVAAAGALRVPSAKAPLEGQLWRLLVAIDRHGPLSAKMAKGKVGLGLGAARDLLAIAGALGLVDPVWGTSRFDRSPKGASFQHEYGAMLRMIHPSD